MIELIPKGSIVEQVCVFLRERSVKAYLVGGCVRDWLLGRSSHDIDFAVAGDAVELARRVADRKGGAFVLLDQERCTARVVTRGEDGQRFFIDFARLQGDDIITDLSKRDFTVNAIAVEADTGSRIIDPYSGQRDLQLGLVRAVSEMAFLDDPLRTLRAVRLAAEMEASIEQGTEELIRRAVHLIANVSAERVRDELSKILALPGAPQNLRYLDEFGLLVVIIPELETLKGVEQSAPHYLDVFEHSLETVRWLEQVVDVVEGYDGEEVADGALSLIPLFLSPFSRRLSAHLSQPISGDCTRLTVLKLVALLHDLGKPATKSFDDEGGIHFYGHEGEGAGVVGDILRRLRFGGNEVNLAKTIVAHHMRPSLLADQEVITRRAVYRFFRDTGDAGVDTLLFYLADHLATWGPNLRMARWQRRVEFVASMLADYYERHHKVISPPKLISGHDLMEECGLEEGPRIGELLEAVREAQVEGEVRTREEALALVKELLFPTSR